MNDKDKAMDAAELELTDEQIRLRFFKNLTAEQRLAVFKVFGVYPDDCAESLNHSIEWRLLKAILNRRALTASEAPVVPEGWRESLALTVERLNDDAEIHDRSGHNSTAEDRRARAYEISQMLAAPSSPALGEVEGMAESMHMFRDDMIKAGVISENVSPMMMTEAILGAIRRDRGRALEGAAQQDGWEPIQTAPRDGTYILVANKHGAWIAKHQPVYASGYRPENPWASMMLNHDHIGEKWHAPTHWQPMPAPPVSAGKEQANG